MADETYELPQVVALALQSQRGELLKALLNDETLTELLTAMNRGMLSEILKLLADLVDDRYKLRRKVQVYAEYIESFRGARDEMDNILRDLSDELENLK